MEPSVRNGSESEHECTAFEFKNKKSKVLKQPLSLAVMAEILLVVTR